MAENCSNSNALSPIINNYWNTNNSDDISQGFITSTENPSFDIDEPILFRPKKFYTNKKCIPYTTPIDTPSGSQNLAPVSNKPNKENTQLEPVHQSIEEIKIQLKTLQKTLDATQKNNELHRAAQNKLMMENLAYVKKNHHALSGFLGKNDELIEIEMLFPIKTIAELSDLETSLGDQQFETKIDLYLRRLKGSSTLESVFRSLATDDVYHLFNLEGRAGKRSLNSLKLFNTVLFDACGGILGKLNYNKELRKCVLHAHNRYFKKSNK